MTDLRKGEEVIVTSYQLGTGHSGGFSEVSGVPAEWAVPVLKGLSVKEAVIVGTAGFTAGLSLQMLEDNGLEPGQGPVPKASIIVELLSCSVGTMKKYHLIPMTAVNCGNNRRKNLQADVVYFFTAAFHSQTMANCPSFRCPVTDPFIFSIKLFTIDKPNPVRFPERDTSAI